jgi:hypothetical protein
MDFEGGEDISDWTFGGNWTIDTNDAYSGTGSAMSYDNGTYSMSTSMFTETGVLKFYYNEKFYSYSSYLILSIDDSAVATIGKTNNNGNWKIFEYYIEGGEHNFTWISENVGNPEYFYIRIDAISFP